MVLTKIESQNKKLEQILSRHNPPRLHLPTDIPQDPNSFYQDFGLLQHPYTKQPVERLTEYQKAVWNDGFRYKYRLVIKSQKVGISTTALMEDFQKAITTCKGKEILIIAQDVEHAKDHLYTLRKMITNSHKYKSYLIDKPTELLLKDEVTKVMTIYLHNPDNPHKPTRIIGLGGSNPGSIWSWKEVAHIHMSDIVASTKVDDSEVFGAAFSRLANTGGTMLIETPPRGPSGKVYEIYETSKLKQVNKEKLESQFKVREIPYTEAIQAGVIRPEVIEGEKERLGVMFPMYYECEFFNSASTWYKPEYFVYGDYVVDM